MSKKNWYVLWGILYILCGALGFVPEAEGLLKGLLVVLGLLFFVPPGVLLYNAVKTKDLPQIRLLRNLSALSLGATLVFMILNLVSAAGGNVATGDALYAVLVMVSSPMYCIRNGLVSLFLWACILMLGIRYSRKKK